jgi:phospho-N-acetylmuramoyl-pentapeptide-transferase
VGLVLWGSPDEKSNENIVLERQGQEVVIKHPSGCPQDTEDDHGPFVKGHNLDYSQIMSVFASTRLRRDGYSLSS